MHPCLHLGGWNKIQGQSKYGAVWNAHIFGCYHVWLSSEKVLICFETDWKVGFHTLLLLSYTEIKDG